MRYAKAFVASFFTGLLALGAVMPVTSSQAPASDEIDSQIIADLDGDGDREIIAIDNDGDGDIDTI